MALHKITLKHFRCFKDVTFFLTAQAPDSQLPGVTLIQGNNGSGKTSLLEALHYGCYLKSFRTHQPAELVHDDTTLFNGFSLTITTTSDVMSVAVAGKKRVIKVNGTMVTAYHELIKIYKVITFIEDDIACITGHPEARRNLLDNALLLHEPSYYALLKSARKIIDQRTAILQAPLFHHEQYQLWTRQLIEVYSTIVDYRQNYLNQLRASLASITQLYGTDQFISLTYKAKHAVSPVDDLEKLCMSERKAQRTLIGPHLDDIDIMIYNRNARMAASRGQQKLACMLIKIAQTQLLQQTLALKNESPVIVFLIDDFLTDFDELRIRNIMQLLYDLNVQLIITIPQPHALLTSLCAGRPDFLHIDLASDAHHADSPLNYALSSVRRDPYVSA